MRGIRLEGKKESSLITWTLGKVRFASRVRVPLRQYLEPPSEPCVQPGDHVLAGQMVARPCEPFSVAAHASISGRVTDISSFPHPLLGTCPAVEITAGQRQETVPQAGSERPGWEGLEKEALFSLFQENGLVEMDRTMLPLHWKAAHASRHKIHTLVINACDNEPYVTAEHSLMMSHPLEILKGAEILRRLTGADRTVIAVQKDAQEAAEVLKSRIYFLKWENYTVQILPAVYPAGLTQPLIQTLMGREFRFRPSRRAAPALAAMLLDEAVHEQGFSVYQMGTAFAVYDAVVLQKPLIERAVTVAGECIIEPRNFWVPVGLSFEEAMKAAKGLMREPGRVVMGGPMQGRAQPVLDVPVLKGTTAVLALPREITDAAKTEPCIHCGRCVESCPVDISPVMITLAAEHGFYEEAAEWGIDACIDCGNCTYVCPAKRPMAKLIDDARAGLESLEM